MDPINNSDNGKVAGIVSYFSIIGWLISYFALYQNNKTDLARYQLRQTLLFHIAYMVLRYGLSIVLGAIWLSTGFFSLWGVIWLVQIVAFILWIIGLIGAIQGEKKPIPIIGEPAQNIFSSI